MPFGQLGQTITVVNKSGKVVSTSKQLVNVWKEARAAYRERKAEINAVRSAELEERRARKALKQLQLEDDTLSRASSRRSSKHPQRSRSHRHADRPPTERGYSDSFYEGDHIYDDPGRRRSTPRMRMDRGIPEEYEDGNYDSRHQELIRRHTDGEYLHSGPVARRHSAPDSHSPRSSIDMDLAYGDLPPPPPERRLDDGQEIRSQMSKLQVMLDEANCLQHSATAMIEHLQQHPDALAAVGLTLAEISNLAAKMAPGALAALKTSFPAVMALLASPQFLIAAGVGVGVTVVMLGGYKIIKRIKDTPNAEPMAFGAHQFQSNPQQGHEIPMDELQEIEIGAEVSRIENWRRGIADAEAESVGTTVDGEFVTPGAGQYLLDTGALRPEDLKSTKSGKSKGRRTSKSERGGGEREREKERKHKKRSDDASTVVSSRSGATSVREKEGKRKKAVGGIKMLFHGTSAVA